MEPLIESIQKRVEQHVDKVARQIGRTVTEQVDQYAQALGPYLVQNLSRSLTSNSILQLQTREHTILVHPQLLNRIAGLLPFRNKQEPSWSCPEQAELVQSCLTTDHVLAILPTGSGKTLAFLAAAWLNPEDLFLVIVPLTALVNDLARRLASTPISGSIYPHCDSTTHRIIFVPAHLAATDTFREWSNAVNYRLNRIFIDEAHHLFTSGFRPEFPALQNLTALAKPITFLSATIFPRSVNELCNWMSIDRNLLHEIRSTTARKNISYHVVHVATKAEALKRIQELVSSITLESHERGLIYGKTIDRVNALANLLDLPKYYSKMHDDEVQNADIKKKLQDSWYDAKEDREKWMIATMGFGQGIDFPTVRYVIHYDVHGLMHFIQESGRGGRDGSICESHVFYTELPFLSYDDLSADHIGVQDMIRYLQTTLCRRLEFYPVYGVAHSCASLFDAQLCDQCKALDKASYILYFSIQMLIYFSFLLLFRTWQKICILWFDPLFSDQLFRAVLHLFVNGVLLLQFFRSINLDFYLLQNSMNIVLFSLHHTHLLLMHRRNFHSHFSHLL